MGLLTGLARATDDVLDGLLAGVRFIKRPSRKLGKTYNRPTVKDPAREMFPGIYQRPQDIIDQAGDRIVPESPLLEELFGVNRADLDALARERYAAGGFKDQPIFIPPKGGPKYVERLQTKGNEERLQDIVNLAVTDPRFAGIFGWYENAPLLWKFQEALGPDEGYRAWTRLHHQTSGFSPGSDVAQEIRRGSLARMIAGRGEGAGFLDNPPPAGAGHIYHRSAHQMARPALEGGLLRIDPQTAPKVGPYNAAKTGEQMDLAVPDAHFSRGVGLPDVRMIDDASSASAGEYYPVQHWWRESVMKPIDVPSVPGQAALWTALGPQTGVKTGLGKPLLELYADAVGREAKRTGKSRLRVLDEFIRSEGSLWGAGGAAMLGAGLLSTEDAEAAVAPKVLDELRNIARAAGATSDDVASAFDALRGQLVGGSKRGGSMASGAGRMPVYDRGSARDLDGAVGTAWSLPKEYKDELGKLRVATPDIVELPGSEVGAKRFHDALSAARDASPYGKAVTLYPQQEYEGMRLFLTEDRKAGFALKPDGDIVSVFNHPESPHKNVGPSLVFLGVQQGGRKLDAYDTVLPSIYSTVGFRESARVPFTPEYAPDGWPYGLLGKFNKGQPDVVLMHQELTRPAAPRPIGPEDYNPHRPLAPDWSAAAENQALKMRAGMRAEDAAGRAARREKLAREQTHVPFETPPAVTSVTTGLRDMLFDPENILGFLPASAMALLWPRQLDNSEQLPHGELARQLRAAGH